MTPRTSDCKAVDSDEEWTPGLGSNYDNRNREWEYDSDEPTEEVLPWPVTVFNSSMANLGEVAGKSVEQLSYQLESWDDSSDLRFYAKPNRHAN